MCGTQPEGISSDYLVPIPDCVVADRQRFLDRLLEGMEREWAPLDRLDAVAGDSGGTMVMGLRAVTAALAHGDHASVAEVLRAGERSRGHEDAGAASALAHLGDGGSADGLTGRGRDRRAHD